MSLAAIDEISRACFRSFSVLPGAQLFDEERFFGVATRVPIGFFSGVATAQLKDGGEVDAVLDRFRALDRPFRWWISPSTEPAGLAEHLQNRGMRHVWNSVGMAVELARRAPDPPLPGGVTIDRVETTDLAPWFSVVLTAFGRTTEQAPIWSDAFFHLRESWTCFAASLDGEMVATTSLLLAGDLAGVYHVATLPDARGRGIGAALTATALRYASEHGAKTAALQSSPMGLNVYRSLGFVAYCDLSLYDWTPQGV